MGARRHSCGVHQKSMPYESSVSRDDTTRSLHRRKTKGVAFSGVWVRCMGIPGGCKEIVEARSTCKETDLRGIQRWTQGYPILRHQDSTRENFMELSIC